MLKDFETKYGIKGSCRDVPNILAKLNIGDSRKVLLCLRQQFRCWLITDDFGISVTLSQYFAQLTIAGTKITNGFRHWEPRVAT